MTKMSHLICGAALALCLSGCSTFGLGSPFDLGSTPSDALQSEVAALSAPASWVLGQQADGELAQRWADVVSDPLLDEYIERALQNNPSLRASAENVARSEAIVIQAKSARLPLIGADVSSNGGGALEGRNFADNYSAGLSASWEADLWGGIDAGILGSEYDLEATRAVYENARQALIAAVARAYVAVIESDLLVALSEQTLAAQEETYRIVNVRYELGAASRRELVLAESDVASAKDNLVITKANKRTAALSLEALLGEYPNADIAVSANFPNLSPLFETGTPTEMLRRRPDVVASEFAVLSAFQATRGARADGWPSLTLSGGIDTGSGNITDLLDPISVFYSLGARLADVLFDGGLTQARIDVASASQRQALADYGQTALDAYFDVETALNDIRTLSERVPHVSRNAETARETLRLSEIQYKEGAVDLLDVLTFRQRSFQADSVEITLRGQIIEARIALYLALGGTANSVSSL